MKRIFCVLIFALASISQAQSFNEKILDDGQSNTCSGAVAMGDHVFFNFSSSSYYKGPSQKSIIYKADNSIHLMDSIDMSQTGGLDNFMITNMIEDSDSTFMVVGQGYQMNPYRETMMVLVMDKSFNILQTYDGGLRTDSMMGAATACRVDSFLLVGGFQRRSNNSLIPAYFIFDKNGGIRKKVLIDSAAALVNSLHYQNGYVYAGFRPSIHLNLMKIEAENFSVDTIFSDLFGIQKSLSYAGFYNLSNNSSEFYGYGELGWSKLAISKIDTNLNISILDSFVSVSNPTYPDHSTIADIGVLSAKDERNIFFATGEGSYYIAQQLDSGLITNMKLWRVDTGGNVIWSVLVNDSSYYFPMKTLATSDGGAVFFSMKYDWRKDVAPKTDLSIIKLDSNGNFVGLHEMEIPYQKPLAVSVYPNPTVDEITLSGVELRDLAAILVYTVDGILIKEVVNPQSLTISMEDVSAGTYVIHTLYKNGRQGMGKVVKRD